MTADRRSRSALAFIFVTVLLDSTGFGIIVPVMPALIIDVTGETLGAAATYGGWLLFVYALMQLFSAPVMGNLSDRFGRRPVLIVSLFAFGLDYILMSWAPTLGWLFLGRFIAGAAAATFSIANAYIADVTPPEERAQGFGLIGAAFGLGFILGPVIGGLLGEYGERVPFVAAAVLTLLNATYGFFVLPESLPRERRRAFAWKRANPVGAMLQIRRYPLVAGLAISVFLYVLGQSSLPSTWSFYGIEKFGWSERDIGYSLGFIGLLVAFVRGYLTGVVTPRLGETRTVYLGLALGVIAYVGYAHSAHGWVMYAFMVPGALGDLAYPAVQAIASNRVPPDAQGELQGAFTSLMSLTSILGPPLMTQLFSYFTRGGETLYYPGAAFAAAAFLSFASLLVFARVMRSSPASAAAP